MQSIRASSGARASAAAGAGRVWAWRAHAWGGEAELRLERVREPALLRPDHVLVRVTAAALNPLDAAMLRGYGATLLALRRRLGGDAPAPPLVVGRDACGEVERAGAAARLRPGQRVWLVAPPHAAGTLAQRVVVRDAWAGPAPARLGAAAGGALYAALTARAALRAAAARRLLLLGLGGVGQAALQLAAAEGAHVTVACAADAHELARELGAAAALDARAPDYDARLAAAGHFDAVLDCAGRGGWEAAARPWRFSRYVTLTSPLLAATDAQGAAAGGAAAAAALAAQCAAAARAQLGAGPPGAPRGPPGAPRGPPGAPRGPRAAACLPPHVRWAFFSSSPADIDHIRRLVERGKFGVRVSGRWAWRAAPAALAALAGGHARGKLLLDFTDHSDLGEPLPAGSTHTQ